jgi:hypothetical protein
MALAGRREGIHGPATLLVQNQIDLAGFQTVYFLVAQGVGENAIAAVRWSVRLRSQGEVFGALAAGLTAPDWGEPRGTLHD